MSINTEPENWLENIYPVKITESKKTSSGYILNNKYLLKPTELSSERLIFVHTAIKYLHQQNFSNAECFIETNEGAPFCQFDGKNYILTKYQPCATFSFDEKQDLEIATELLAKLHLASKDFTEEKATSLMESQKFPFTVKCPLGETLSLFTKRYNEIKKFIRLSAGSVNAFELSFHRIAGSFCNMAEESIKKLEISDYDKICVMAKKEGCLCHRNYTGHNIVKSQPPTIVNFDDVAIELPVFDLANMLRRCLRKCNGSIEEALFILKVYDRIKPLSKSDIEILKALLLFPQKLWRISNKYYNSKKSRYEKTALSKLEEIMQERDPLLNLIKSLPGV